jgi:hypothetical protein
MDNNGENYREGMFYVSGVLGGKYGDLERKKSFYF